MSTPDDLLIIIERIINGSAIPADLALLKDAFASRSICIGGDANHATIVTGDGNTISLGPDVQTLIAALQHAGYLGALPRRPDTATPFLSPEAKLVIERVAQCDSLHNRLAEVRSSNEGQVALVTSKRGYGRSALVRKFGAEAAAQAAIVCYGQFFPDVHQHSGFYAPNAEAITTISPSVEHAWPAATALAGPVWVWIVAQIAHALGRVPTPADLRTPDNPSALRAVLRQVRQPCVLVLERWEYASEEWVHLIRELPKALLNEKPLLVVLTLTLEQQWGQLTSNVIQQRPPFAAVQTLRERAKTTFYWLGDLKVADVAAFIGPTTNPELPEHLHTWSGGQPVLVEEVWNLWQAEGMVAQNAAGMWTVLKPADIRGSMYDFFSDIIKGRLQVADAADDFEIIDQLLTHAAVEGLICTADVAAEASGRYLDETLELWDEYLLPTTSEPGILDIIADAAADVTRYRFTSLAAQRAWEREGQDAATLLRVAEALEAVYHGSSDAVAERLIGLFESLGQPARAQPYYQRRQYAAHTGMRLRWLLESARLTAQRPHEWQHVFNRGLDLAEFYYTAGQYPAAEQAARAALSEPYTPSLRERVRALNWIGLSLIAQGQYAAAAIVLCETLAMIEPVLGAAHPDTLTTRTNLAEVLREQGDYAAARPIFEQVLEIQEQTLGPAHPSTLATRNNLARVLQDQKLYGEAEALMRLTVEQHETVLGADHPVTQGVKRNYAALLAQLQAAEGEQPDKPQAEA